MAETSVAKTRDSESTRARLLAVAAGCFSERGYRGTSVRDITARVGCNVSAVTYHFGGKQKLYEAVFEQRFTELTERRVGALRALMKEGDVELERIIATFSEAFLEPLRGGAHGRESMLLLMREMVDGQLPVPLIRERLFGPTLGALMDALKISCPGLRAESLELCCHSLVSQLVHVLHMQRLGERAGPTEGLEDTLAHITRFTAAGIRASSGGGPS